MLFFRIYQYVVPLALFPLSYWLWCSRYNYDHRLTLFARILPGIRSPIFLMAGMNHMSVRKFLLADGLYAIPGVSTMFFLAYVFTDQFVALVRKADSYRQVIVVFVIGVAVGYLAHFFQKHPVAEGDPKEVPIIGQQIASHIKDPDNEKPSGEWNTIELLTVGQTSVHVVNGKVVMVLTNSRHMVKDKETPLTKGKIQLQSEGAEIFYRNIAIRSITKIPEEYLK